MSQYGNVPDEDVNAIHNAIRVSHSLIRTLPPLAPSHWRDVAYEAVLNGILSDWVANGTNELDSSDEQDLTDILRLCVESSLAGPDEVRDLTFKVTINSAMNDWVENWNTDEE